MIRGLKNTKPRRPNAAIAMPLKWMEMKMRAAAFFATAALSCRPRFTSVERVMSTVWPDPLRAVFIAFATLSVTLFSLRPFCPVALLGLDPPTS
jgi:hypothetical protein